MQATNENIREILAYIDPAVLTYEEWLSCGMALKDANFPCSVWDEWSQNDTRYHAGECERKWNTFNGSSSPVTIATVMQMAYDNGYRSSTDSYELDWDSEIGGSKDDFVIVDKNWIESKEIKEPAVWNPAGEIIKYLETLFDSTETVGYVTETWEKDGKFMPSKGSYTHTAGELIQELGKHKDDIGAVIGDYNKSAGAWVRFNPLDGKGVKNENVTDFRFALVESDTMEIDKQNAVIRELELPVAVLVYSGKKSLHAIVRIEAANYDEYRKRVDYLYNVCKKNGLQIDSQNRNPSRLSRLPGIERGENKQFIVDTNIGKASFAEWKEWIESVNDDLPDIKNYADIADNLPPLSPVLIDGILRQGHKMLLAGPSKAGKSYALIELAIAIASGTSWLGFQCAQGKVLYVNFEIDEASYLHRIDDVCKALKISKNCFENIDFWSLRGLSVPMDKLTPKLIRRAIKKDYIAIIIDPIYKVITGDENSAEEMAKFCNQFDRIAHELQCAVIYCHHHSKGSQGWKTSMDRASGSGVFARDPDAMIDMLELAVPSVEIEEDSEIVDNRTAWRIEGTLREFPPFRPKNVFYSFPIHYLDESNILDNAVPKGSRESNVVGNGKAKGTQEERDAEHYNKLCIAFEKAKDPKLGTATVTQIVESWEGSGGSRTNVKRYLKLFDDEFQKVEGSFFYRRLSSEQS